MDRTQNNLLVDRIVTLLNDHENWFQANETRATYVHGRAGVYVERSGDAKKIYRVTWQYPDTLTWEKDTPGFSELVEACETLFSFFREKLCELTIAYVSFPGIVGFVTDTGKGEKESFEHFRWLKNHVGFDGRWWWSYGKGTFWFEFPDEASHFKLARLGEP